jgi:LPS export ABC transporter protein LptC
MHPPSQSGRTFKTISFSSIIIMWMIMLFSCENDMAVVNEITKRDTLPVVSSYEIQVNYSEKGHPQFILEAPVALFYSHKETYQEFPEGFHVRFFDSLMNVKSELSADYGINYERNKLMEARRNVVVINHEKDETLNTEEMTWDQNKKKIFSNVFVKIKTASDVLYGENGFEADESFNNWVIRKTSGEIEIDSDE